MTIWDCQTHVRMTSMTSSVEWTDLDFKISVALIMPIAILLYDSIGFVFRYHYILSIKVKLFTMLSVFASNNR